MVPFLLPPSRVSSVEPWAGRFRGRHLVPGEGGDAAQAEGAQGTEQILCALNGLISPSLSSKKKSSL